MKSCKGIYIKYQISNSASVDGINILAIDQVWSLT